MPNEISKPKKSRLGVQIFISLAMIFGGFESLLSGQKVYGWAGIVLGIGVLLAAIAQRFGY